MARGGVKAQNVRGGFRPCSASLVTSRCRQLAPPVRPAAKNAPRPRTLLAGEDDLAVTGFQERKTKNRDG
jgi:hypothetical protein